MIHARRPIRTLNVSYIARRLPFLISTRFCDLVPCIRSFPLCGRVWQNKRAASQTFWGDPRES